MKDRGGFVKFPIPDAALESHIAILGKTGSGKTVAAKGMVENVLDAGGRACAIDPTGVWHGLRSNASGKGAGYPVVIFGGPHGDVPLGAAHGEAIAEIIGTSSTSAVIDTSAMRVSERTRFFADFGDALIRKNKGPLHLVIDEAHLFMPQGRVADPQSGQMLHAANNLVSLGRSRGLRITIISQRPAKVHKDSLTQVETLVAMRLIAPQDRRAVEDWIADNADQAKGKEIIASLATLKTGDAWIWAPELGILERAHFPKNRTFDSSRAPDGDESGIVLAPINLKSVHERLGAIEAEAKANNPHALKAEIATLKKQLASAPKETVVANKADMDRAHSLGHTDGYQQGWRDGDKSGFSAGVAAAVNMLKQSIGSIASVIYTPGEPPKRIPKSDVKYAEPMQAPRALPVQRQEHPAPRITNGSGSVRLPPGERAVLTAAAQFEGVDRDQLSVLTGYKRSSRDAYIQRLREKGYVEISGQTIAVTPDGEAALPADYEPLPTGTALQDYWRSRLPEGERKILEELIAAYPNPIARSDLDDATGYKRSSRDAYIQRMKAKRLVIAEGSNVRASEDLFS